MRSRTARSLGAAGLAVTLTCAGTTACSVIPIGGRSIIGVDDVRKGNPLGDPYARVVAVSPSPDWTAEEVVTGFRAAMASVDDPRRDIARKYLTDDFAKKWDPQSGVTVYKQTEAPRKQQGSDANQVTVTLNGTVTATVGQDGRYQPSGGSREVPFTLAKGPKGWRISSAPNGLLLSEADVDRAYLKVDLYFLDSARTGLVVDQVRVPIDPTSNFAKTTVKRLLKGPSGLLKNAVNSAFESGTELNDVFTENNRVVVDLTKRVDSEQIIPMSAQLAGTLAELTKGGWGFEIRVNGEPYYSSDSPLLVDAQQHSRFDPWLAPGEVHPFYLADGALLQLRENTGQPVLGKAGEKDGTRTHPAISDQGQQVAALSKDGKTVSVAPLTQGGEWQPWVTGDKLTPPSWDRYHTLWTVNRSSDHSSKVLRRDENQQYEVSAPDLDTTDVKALKVARDGVHVAVVTRNGLDEEEVLIGTVIGQGSYTRITALQTVVPPDGKQTIEDIAWKDGKTLYVLTGKFNLLEASVTAEAKSLASYSGIQSITALDGSLLAGAKDEDGNLQVLSWNHNSAKWETLVKNQNGAAVFVKNGPSSPAYPLG
ncbi:LpqB family beta-propeller domain-containing protein [Streptosporangium sp. NPDC000396]|uniref:LpqB family beta-propeller domain-containing protein n=1 Tax=Streptosporangium sp. NPDC000396 TaxID=3366185 RepID=UPI0036A2FBC8